MATLERAIEIAYEAHAGQTRRDGKPYVSHPLAVKEALEADGESVEVQIIGVLHDVPEDCEDWPLERLAEEGFSETVLETLGLLKREKGEDYDEYAERIARHALARRVKTKDMKHNRGDNPTPEQKERYTRWIARYVLEDCLSA